MQQMPLLGRSFDEALQFASHEAGDPFDIGAKTAFAETGNRWTYDTEVTVATVGEIDGSRQKRRSGP